MQAYELDKCVVRVSSTASLVNNDDNERHICDLILPITEVPTETLIQSNENILSSTENIDDAIQTSNENIINSIPDHHPNIDDLLLKRLFANLCEGTSVECNLCHHDQSTTLTAPISLSTSLQFARDVDPYQKIQYDSDVSDNFKEKLQAPYVARIQGIKDETDKGKLILPRIKVCGNSHFLV